MAFIKLLTKAAKKGVKSATKKEAAKVANRLQKTTSSVAASKGVKSMQKTLTMAFINKQPPAVRKELMKRRKKFLADRAAAAESRKKVIANAKATGKKLPKLKGRGMSFESVPTKRDKRIEGSGSQSSRPPGSKGKASVKSDSPRGSVAGLSMADARKAQARKNKPGNIKSKTVATARKYDDLMVGVKRRAVAALRAGDRDKARKILSGTGISVSDFISVIRQRGKM
tara:strand:+ start:4537 stop:5217 length:681 start_codon:yes stop_codon:yes gene_type:complete